MLVSPVEEESRQHGERRSETWPPEGGVSPSSERRPWGPSHTSWGPALSQTGRYCEWFQETPRAAGKRRSADLWPSGRLRREAALPGWRLAEMTSGNMDFYGHVNWLKWVTWINETFLGCYERTDLSSSHRADDGQKLVRLQRDTDVLQRWGVQTLRRKSKQTVKQFFH